MNFQELYDKAQKAGMEAANGHVPRPMIVQEHKDMMDDNSPVEKEYYVPQGICGFAWVVVKPGNCPFANWLKRNDIAKKHYYGGVSIWIFEHGQSYEKKQKHASTMANVFKEAGIKAYSGSRLD